jgi:GTP cyclohydrolase I
MFRDIGDDGASQTANGSRSNGNGHHPRDELLAGAKLLDMVELGEAADGGAHEISEADSAIESAVRDILLNVGEDPDRDGLLKTPARVARMFGEMLAGYSQDLETVVNGALFEVDYGEGEMVVVANIPYDSLCEHHMLPFTGRVHVAYIPRDKVVGLSKIPRIVDMFARRLQIQERLGNQVADAIEEALEPRGVMVLVEGQHSCAALRGVKKHGVNMVSTAVRGEFRTNSSLRDEFYRLVGR